MAIDWRTIPIQIQYSMMYYIIVYTIVWIIRRHEMRNATKTHNSLIERPSRYIFQRTSHTTHLIRFSIRNDTVWWSTSYILKLATLGRTGPSQVRTSAVYAFYSFSSFEMQLKLHECIVMYCNWVVCSGRWGRCGRSLYSSALRMSLLAFGWCRILLLIPF